MWATETMNATWPRRVKDLGEIWGIENPDTLVSELASFLSHKKYAREAPLNETEHAFLLLASMQSWIEMEGFQDLFYQQHTLADCHLVENTLRDLGAERLAQLLAEARDIYTRHRPDMTQEEYEQLDPFNLPTADGRRFDEIADAVYAKDSQLFGLSIRLAEFAKQHRGEFRP